MGNIYLDGKNGFAVDEDRLADFTVCPVVSAEVDLHVAATTTCVEVPPGSIVTKVALWNNSDTDVGGSGDIDVGTSGDTDKFIDGLSELTAGDISISTVGTYLADGGAIVIKANDANGADGSTGKLLVWYTTP